MSLSLPKGIIFDLGDTLVTVTYHGSAGVERLMELAHNPRSVPISDIIARHDELVAEARALWGHGWETLNRSILHRNLFEPFGITFDLPDSILDLEYCVAVHDLDPEPHAIEMLAEMHSRGVKMGVLSNSMIAGTSLATVLNRIGMLPYFEYVMSSADYGFAKPHPRIFMTAIEKLDLPADDCYFFGDTIDIDVIGSEAVGMTGIWYNPKNRTAAPPAPKHIITGWDHFLNTVG